MITNMLYCRIARPTPRTHNHHQWQRTNVCHLPIALGLLMSCATLFAGDAIPVTVVQPRIGTLRQIERTTGELKAVRRATLQFKTAGTIATVAVAEGDRVRTGQVLARLDTTDAQLGLDQAAATVDIANRQIKALQTARDAARVLEEQAVIRLDLARRELDRAQTLRGKEAMTVQQFDQIEGQFRLAKNGLDAARKQATQAESALEVAGAQRAAAEVGVRLARKRIDDSTLVAPFDGLIVTKNVQAHEWADKGPAFAIADDSRLELTARLAERFLPQVQAGMYLFCKTPLQPAPVAATIATVIPSIDPVGRAFTIKAEIDNSAHQLSHGGYADVDVVLRENRDACILPETVVVITDATATTAAPSVGSTGDLTAGPAPAAAIPDRCGFVFVVEREQARRVPVTIGVVARGEAAVTSGLTANTTVIGSGLDKITDGARVTPSATTASSPQTTRP